MKKRTGILRGLCLVMAATAMLSFVGCSGIDKEVEEKSKISSSTKKDKDKNKDKDKDKEKDDKKKEDKENEDDKGEKNTDDYIEEYKNYLKNGYNADGDWFKPNDGTWLYSPKFSLFDVNFDGYKDVLVKGDLGLRCKEFTAVYFYNPDNNSYTELVLDGSPIGYTSDCLILADYDYGGAGEIMYNHDYVFQFDGDESHAVVEHFRTTEAVETEDGDIDYNDTEDRYYVNGQESDEDSFYDIYYKQYYDVMNSFGDENEDEEFVYFDDDAIENIN